MGRSPDSRRFLWQDVADAVAAYETQTAELEKLAAFKSWCHAYLDQKGIPTHPDGPHSREGCRIGDRLDAVFAELAAARALAVRLAVAIENCIRMANHRQSEWGGRAVDAFEFLDAALAEARAADITKETT